MFTPRTATQALAKGDTEEAILFFTDELTENGSLEAKLGLGVAYKMQYQFAKAITTFQQILNSLKESRKNKENLVIAVYLHFASMDIETEHFQEAMKRLLSVGEHIESNKAYLSSIQCAQLSVLWHCLAEKSPEHAKLAQEKSTYYAKLTQKFPTEKPIHLAIVLMKQTLYTDQMDMSVVTRLDIKRHTELLCLTAIAWLSRGNLSNATELFSFFFHRYLPFSIPLYLREPVIRSITDARLGQFSQTPYERLDARGTMKSQLIQIISYLNDPILQLHALWQALIHPTFYLGYIFYAEQSFRAPTLLTLNSNVHKVATLLNTLLTRLDDPIRLLNDTTKKALLNDSTLLQEIKLSSTRFPALYQMVTALQATQPHDASLESKIAAPSRLFFSPSQLSRVTPADPRINDDFGNRFIDDDQLDIAPKAWR